MDRFANLDLLSSGKLSQGLVKLWLNILADSQILDLTASQKPRYCGTPHPMIPNTNSNPQPGLSLCVGSCSETDQEVLVQHYFVLDGEEHHCAAPFSWLLTLHLEHLWEESEFVPGLSHLDERTPTHGETIVTPFVAYAEFWAPQQRQKVMTAGSSSL